MLLNLGPSTPTTTVIKREDDQEEEEDEDEDGDSKSGKKSGSNIMLWQFLKELLLQPESYSGCIHWLDREKGVFKIVDSVKVATLWGKRKVKTTFKVLGFFPISAFDRMIIYIYIYIQGVP